MACNEIPSRPPCRSIRSYTAFQHAETPVTLHPSLGLVLVDDMTYILSLPTELILMIAGELDLNDLMHLNASCSYIRSVLDFERFFHMFDSFDDPGPERDQALGDASSLVLSHFLLHYLEAFTEWDSRRLEDSEALVSHGASLSLIPSGRYLETLFLDEGLSERTTFALRSGASVHEAPSGINNLLWSVFDNEGHSPAVDFLLEQGASFQEVPDIEQLFANKFYEGPSSDVDLLTECGLKLMVMPDDIYELYNDFWFQDGDDAELDEDSRASLVEVVELLREIAKNNPKGFLEELERVCHDYSIISARLVIEEEPSWSLQLIPGGIDRLFEDFHRTIGLKEIIFLLSQGAKLEKTNLDKTELLEDAFVSFGPGHEVNILMELCHASFQEVKGGVNRLLEDVYLGSGRGDKRKKINYLIEKEGADLKLAPHGLPKLLEDCVSNLGLESEEVTILRSAYGVDLKDVPCGFPRLLGKHLQTIKPGNLSLEVREYIVSLRDNQQDLDMLLETAFRVHGLEFPEGKPSQEPLELLLDLGTSFKRIPGSVGALLEETFRRFGYCDKLRFLLRQSGSTMLEVPCGIHALLQAEILNGDRSPTLLSLDNAEFSISQGASLADMPAGSHKVLGEILERFGKGPRSGWLIKNGLRLKDDQ